MKINTTISEIAKIAKVNKSTVSRALNNSPLVNGETKKKIMEIARDLQYFPNSLARGLINRKSETIGIMLLELSSLKKTLFIDILKGIESACVKYGYNMLIASLSEQREERTFPFNLIKCNRIDGILNICSPYSLNGFSNSCIVDHPVVSINGITKDKNKYCVNFDNYEGGVIGANYFIKRGHSRIAVLTGNQMFNFFKERIRGYRSVLIKNNILFDKNLLQFGCFEDEIKSGELSTYRLLDLPVPPTAIFALTYELAMGAIKAIKRRGLEIPNDIDLMGYGCNELNNIQHFPITTILQNPFALGFTSCELLINILNRKEITGNLFYVPVELMVKAMRIKKKVYV
ncbi:MAG: LacI family DNA-binding transcriptional regulator [Candidatus Aureabacteria bacterium]|nr:LacI family DNA-binding transcriptional regulator [Candidatus Auribacterota bacterium]